MEFFHDSIESDVGYKMKLQIIKCWILEKSKFNFEKLKIEKNKDIEIEINLLKIYDHIKKKKTEDISHIFEDTKTTIKEDEFFNLSRLYKEAEKYGIKANKSYLEFNSKLK